MLVGLGYEPTKVEKAWMHMEKIMDVYNIPVDKALACSLYSITNQCSIFEPLKDICGVDIKEMEKLVDNLEKTSRFSVGMAMKYFGELLKIISKVFKGKEKIITEDVMSIVSDEWDNMSDEEKKSIIKLFSSAEK